MKNTFNKYGYPSATLLKTHLPSSTLQNVKIPIKNHNTGTNLSELNSRKDALLIRPQKRIEIKKFSIQQMEEDELLRPVNFDQWRYD